MSASTGPAELILVGPLPPPVHGQSVATSGLRDLLVGRGVGVLPVDTGEGTAGGGSARLLRQVAALWTVMRSRAPGLYLSVNAHRGMLATVMLALLGRLKRKALTLHHHSNRYLAKRDPIMELLGKAAGGEALHLVQCAAAGEGLRSMYKSVGRIQPYSNVGVVDPALRPGPVAPEGVIRLGHMSNLTEAKGMGRTIDAFRTARSEGFDARLTVAGPCSEPYSRDAVALAQREFGSAFAYVGPVYGEAKQRFFEAVDIFVFPSRYVTETQGIVNLEALACGRPVVAYAQCCIAGDIGATGGVAVAMDGDFSQALVNYLRRYLQDPAEASRLARHRFEQLLDLHRQERDALLGWIRGAR
ncbi:MAG TPA: glycosyltransferase family 4 protein [Allosphingosinicella sp.]|nr:glycosyltransferase family 4 protein [Allosphingosinicella sp.]